MTISDALNAVIRQTVEDRGMTITGLARVSGVSDNSLKNYLNRGRKMPTPFADKIAQGLDMSLTELLDLAEDYRAERLGQG